MISVLGWIGLVVLVGAGVVAVLLVCWQQEPPPEETGRTPRTG